MPNLKRPKGLIIKRGRWNKLCIECKRRVVRENITKDLETSLCQSCVDMITGKKIKEHLGCKFYKIKPFCHKCRQRFDSDNLARMYCYECRPKIVGDKY